MNKKINNIKNFLNCINLVTSAHLTVIYKFIECLLCSILIIILNFNTLGNNSNVLDIISSFFEKNIAFITSLNYEYNSQSEKDIVSVAASQIGIHGGKKFWSWYGYENRVEWCACFVSWCANECGYIDNGIIPKFASCNKEGIPWFKKRNLWISDKDYIPKRRRYYIL